MDDTLNPYSSPRPTRAIGRTWWQQVVDLFAPERSLRERFLAGEPVIHYGVMIFVDPTDSRHLHIAMPLEKPQDHLIARNRAEVLRVWPEFEAAYPQLQRDISNREVLVRMIPSYQEFQTELCARTSLGMSPLSSGSVSPEPTKGTLSTESSKSF